MIVLDTNVLSEPLRADPDSRLLRWLDELRDPVAVTSISVGEILSGVRALPEGRRRGDLEYDVEERFVELAQLVLPYDEPAAREFALMHQSRRQAGRPLDVVDGMIAGICRSRRVPLATRNVRDFEGLGVDLINPWES